MRTVRMIGVDGSKWNLTDRVSAVQLGVDPALWGTAPAVVIDEERIGQPGSVFEGAGHAKRPLALPLVIRGGIEENVSRLARATDPKRGAVTIVVGRAGVDDEQARQIDAHYVAGLDGLQIPVQPSRVLRCGVALDAHHPYWRAMNAVEVEIEPPGSVWDSSEPTAYDDPIDYDAAIPYTGVQIGDIGYADPIDYDSAIPYDGAAAEALTMTVTNSGDVDAWPEFEVVGPVDRVTAANLTTSRSWVLSDGLLPGQRLTVVTYPGRAAVRISDQLALSKLNDGADLWPLPPGESLVSFEMAGRSAASSFKITHDVEFLTC